MKFLFGVVVLAMLALLATAEQARFDNYRVYSVHIASEKQLEVLKDLENGVSILISPISHGIIINFFFWITSTISGIIQQQ